MFGLVQYGCGLFKVLFISTASNSCKVIIHFRKERQSGEIVSCLMSRNKTAKKTSQAHWIHSPSRKELCFGNWWGVRTIAWPSPFPSRQGNKNSLQGRERNMVQWKGCASSLKKYFHAPSITIAKLGPLQLTKTSWHAESHTEFNAFIASDYGCPSTLLPVEACIWGLQRLEILCVGQNIALTVFVWMCPTDHRSSFWMAVRQLRAQRSAHPEPNNQPLLLFPFAWLSLAPAITPQFQQLILSTEWRMSTWRTHVDLAKYYQMLIRQCTPLNEYRCEEGLHVKSALSSKPYGRLYAGSSLELMGTW